MLISSAKSADSVSVSTLADELYFTESTSDMAFNFKNPDTCALIVFTVTLLGM